MTENTSILSVYLGVMPRTREEHMLRLLIESGRRIVGAEEGSLLVMDEATETLRFAMTVGNPESEQTLLGQSVPLGKGVTGLAAATREVQTGAPTFKDIKQTERTGSEGNEPEAVIAAPMLLGEDLIGVLTAVSFARGKRFTSKEAEVYGHFGMVAGLLVEQSRRLVGYETGSAEALAKSVALGERGRLERDIIESIGRLTRDNPDSLSQIAVLLAAVEGLVLTNRGGR
mgnify:CR=1 FL=1